MAKLFAICSMSGGVPNTAPLVAGVDYKGYALADQVGGAIRSEHV